MTIRATLVALAYLASSCALLSAVEPPSDVRALDVYDLTASGQAHRELQRQQAEQVVQPVLVARRATAWIGVIDDDAMDLPVLDGPVSFDDTAAEGNEVVADELRREARAAHMTLVDQVLATDGAGPSDVAGALTWAASSLASHDGPALLFLHGDMLSTVPPCDLPVLLADGPVFDAIDTCFGEDLPDLTGVEVWMIGGGLDPSDVLDQHTTAALEEFWTTVVQESGGTLQAYGPSILGDGS